MPRSTEITQLLSDVERKKLKTIPTYSVGINLLKIKIFYRLVIFYNNANSR